MKKENASVSPVLFAKELYSVDEFAQFVGVTKLSVYKWVREKEIACFKIGRELRFSQSCITDFLAKRFRAVS